MADLRTYEQFLNLIKPGEDALGERTRRYDHAYDVYRQPERPRKKGDWESQMRIKYGMQVLDTTLVNLIGGSPRAQVRPRRPEDMATAPKMRTVLDYHVAEDHLAEKQPVFVQQGLIYGVTAAKNQWAYREVTRPVRRFIQNPYDPSTPIPYEDEQRLVLRDGPTFEPWDVYDLWWEPNARDVDSALYVVLRSWMTVQEIRLNAATEDNPYGMFDATAVDALLKDGPTATARTTNAQERYLGGQTDKRKDRYELLEVWRETPAGLYQTVLGNRRVVLQDRPTPFWHGKKPVVITQVRPDLFELQGIAETELLDHLQQAMNSLLNMRMDNLHLTVQRGFTYREAGIRNPDDYVLKPRFFWPVTDHDDIQAVQIQPLPPEAYREDEVLLGRMQLVTGINPYISGADLASVDQNTATGVTALQEVASRLLRFKARQIAYKGIRRTFEQWGELVQQFMSSEQAIRVQGRDADVFEWSSLSPQEVVGNYDYDVEGTEESLSRQQERSEALQLLQAFAPFIQAGLVDPKVLGEKVAKAFDMDPRRLFVAPQQGPPAAPQQQGQSPGGPPSTLGGVSLPPNVVGAINGGQQLG